MLLSWRLNYAHDDYRSAFADYFPVHKTFHNSILTFISKWHSVKSRRRITFTGLVRRLLSPSLDRRRIVPTPAPQTSTLWTFNLQNAKQKPPLRMNGIENKISFMKSEVHDCQVDQSHRNFDTIHPTRRLWLVDTESRLAADLHRSGFKVQNKRSIC